MRTFTGGVGGKSRYLRHAHEPYRDWKYEAEPARAGENRRRAFGRDGRAFNGRIEARQGGAFGRSAGDSRFVRDRRTGRGN